MKGHTMPPSLRAFGEVPPLDEGRGHDPRTTHEVRNRESTPYGVRITDPSCGTRFAPSDFIYVELSICFLLAVRSTEESADK